jgi:DNA-directed RNA polymerase I subunit RPA1
VCKAVAKLKLLEYGLLIASKVLDGLTLDQTKEGGKATVRATVEEFEKHLEDYVQLELGRASSARRGDYKDGPVYQARKQVIDDFIKTAHSNSKRCSRPNCGAYVT